MPYMVNWTIATRPNTNVDFFELTDEDRAHFQTYINTGKLHSLQETISPDGLSKTLKMIWYTPNTPEAFVIHDMMVSDPVVQDISLRSMTYNSENGIQRSTMFFEVRDDDGNILDSDDLPNDLLFVKDGVFVNHH